MKILLMYFSKTGTTKALAELIANRLGADIYQIQEEQAYTAADLDWNVPTSRANLEQGDEASRPAYKGELPDVSSYDQIIIGHPTWWGLPPRIIETVIEDLDLSGKQLASFATSGGSSYAQAQTLMNQILDHPAPGRVLSNERDAISWLTAINF
ncbi:flavodoxin [Streptococcus macacae]|uniref:Flavodoxin n=1 Tax=Streptococcus macacae NCTC 11558 TaxID=764298 RepID=G5JZ34_9STRE|nr:flavodoxin [Streptococcus macacae]EHJ53146.1 flavodoxin [Streptococcus macacae NCTC 11558]SUN78288.1 flavodoxin [Streptococcus macacae NCTC 11558]